MFKENNKFEKFESKVWLSSPTMHGPEIEYGLLRRGKMLHGISMKNWDTTIV